MTEIERRLYLDGQGCTWRPRYKHSCSICVFLGQWAQYDLWTCNYAGVTVIAREGDSPSAYSSGLAEPLHSLTNPHSLPDGGPDSTLALHIALLRALNNQTLRLQAVWNLYKKGDE